MSRGVTRGFLCPAATPTERPLHAPARTPTCVALPPAARQHRWSERQEGSANSGLPQKSRNSSRPQSTPACVPTTSGLRFTASCGRDGRVSGAVWAAGGAVGTAQRHLVVVREIEFAGRRV